MQFEPFINLEDFLAALLCYLQVLVLEHDLNKNGPNFSSLNTILPINLINQFVGLVTNLQCFLLGANFKISHYFLDQNQRASLIDFFL